MEQLKFLITDILSVPVFLLFGNWFRKFYHIKFWQELCILVPGYTLSYAWMLFLYSAVNGFKTFGGQNAIRAYAWIPLIAVGVSKILKIPFRTVCDYYAPVLCIAHGLGKIKCIRIGCCCGYPCSWGIENFWGVRCFPVQVFECVVALLVAVFAVIYAKKRNFNCDGTVLAWSMILLGGTRFILEFLRDNDKIFLGCSELSFHALSIAAVGAIMLYFFRKYAAKEQKMLQEG